MTNIDPDKPSNVITYNDYIAHIEKHKGSAATMKDIRAVEEYLGNHFDGIDSIIKWAVEQVIK